MTAFFRSCPSCHLQIGQFYMSFSVILGPFHAQITCRFRTLLANRAVLPQRDSFGSEGQRMTALFEKLSFRIIGTFHAQFISSKGAQNRQMTAWTAILGTFNKLRKKREEERGEYIYRAKTDLSLFFMQYRWRSGKKLSPVFLPFSSSGQFAIQAHRRYRLALARRRGNGYIGRAAVRRHFAGLDVGLGPLQIQILAGSR